MKRAVWTVAFFLAVVLLAKGAASASEFVLFDRDLSILQDLWLPADPSPSQRYAAEEYVAYMKRMTDRTVTVRQVPKTGIAGRPYKRGIVSITTASPADNLGDDGFIVRISNDGLEIRGSRVRGCLYGVYEVLERFGGCRWYSSWCEKVPRPARIAVPMDLNLVERPAFEMRQPHWYDYIVHPLFDAEEGSPAGSVVRFVNAVAEAVEKEFPDVKIETLAYDYSRRPPKKARRRLLGFLKDSRGPVQIGEWQTNDNAVHSPVPAWRRLANADGKKK